MTYRPENFRIYVILGQDSENNVKFPVKTGSFPTAMVDPSFDVEYLSYPGLVEVSEPEKNVNFRFYQRKPVKNRKFLKTRLKRKLIVDFVMNILGTICLRFYFRFYCRKSGKTGSSSKRLRPGSNESEFPIF